MRVHSPSIIKHILSEIFNQLKKNSFLTPIECAWTSLLNSFLLRLLAIYSRFIPEGITL